MRLPFFVFTGCWFFVYGLLRVLAGCWGFWRVGGVFMGGKGRSKDGDGRGVGFVCFVDDNCFAVLRAVLLCFAGFAAVLCWLTPVPCKMPCPGGSAPCGWRFVLALLGRQSCRELYRRRADAILQLCQLSIDILAECSRSSFSNWNSAGTASSEKQVETTLP